MKKFAIIANGIKTDSAKCAAELEKVIKACGCICTATLISGENKGAGDFTYTDPALIPEETEAVISLGGDGTFIHASKDLIGLGLPVFGVNFGTLGYLTEVDVAGFEGALRSIMDEDYELEERMLMRCLIIRDGQVIKDKLVLNDIVINRSLDTGIARFGIYVDGHHLNTYSADGIILSTPTGSTGYNLSAGGPVVLPIARIMLVTPICAHTLNSRTVVLPAGVEVDVRCAAGSQEKEQINYVITDGEPKIELKPGDIVRAAGANVTAKIIKINKTSFIENLSKKMK